MKGVRFPRRDDALRRLCAEEPPLCEEVWARGRGAYGLFAPREGEGFPLTWLLLWLLLALGLFSMSAAPAGAQPRAAVAAPAAGAVVSVEAVGMTVADMDRSVEFYSRVLSFEKVSDVEVWGGEYERLQGVFGLRMRVVRMRLGEEQIELTEYLAPQGRPIPADSRSNDLWFQHVAVITSDMERAYAWLRQHKVRHASTGPQTLPAWNRSAGGIRAFYFRDPDGHALEILQFPEGKGAPKWHEKSGRLFLGIDHTAVVVSDTESSLRFYRDALGLAVAGESENYGPEQERLNNVFGARLRITSLRAPGGGPGVEFLEYLAPRDGRPAPADGRANDLAHWQTTLVTRSASASAAALARGRYAFVSPGVVALTEGVLGLKKGFLVKDPDGHVMKLTEH
ncbi:MAG TPA: VOC family protein [Pyrinomonadaceae bacterium]|nr:VOC family protein [Pyrinomonadaceae bacterium]